jgi:hypothetical protein
MPIHHMLYRCPRCGHDPLDGHKGRAECLSCGTSFEQGRGAVIIARPPGRPPDQTDARSLLAAVEEMGGPGFRTDQDEEILVREAKIRFGVVEGHDVIRWKGVVLGFSEKISRKGQGVLRLEGAALRVTQSVGLQGDSGELEGDRSRPGPRKNADVFSCLLDDIRGVQISSKALQITLGRSRMYQFEFIEDSPKRWEDLVCTALIRFYARSRLSVAEFKPRILTRDADEVSFPDGGGKPASRESPFQRKRGTRIPR